MIGRAGIILVAFMAAGSAACAEPSRDVLYKNCRDPHSFVDGTWDMGFCSGYIAGITNALQLTGSICPPKGTRWGDVTSVVMKYLAQHSKPAKQLAAPLVVSALVDAFTCQKLKSKRD